MRDGSIEDVVGCWFQKVLSDYIRQNGRGCEADFYFAAIRHGATGLYELHRRLEFDSDYADRVPELLHELRVRLTSTPQPKWPRYPEMEGLEQDIDDATDFDQDDLEDYWNSDRWKRDTFTTLTNQFWDFRGYAEPADRKRMHFLDEVSEIWFAAGASALVFYATNDQRRWRKVANSLRELADHLEADGLQRLPWGS